MTKIVIALSAIALVALVVVPAYMEAASALSQVEAALQRGAR